MEPTGFIYSASGSLDRRSIEEYTDINILPSHDRLWTDRLTPSPEVSREEIRGIERGTESSRTYFNVKPISGP
jgi:hypothetical protein